MDPAEGAFIDLVDDVGTALVRYATRLRELAGPEEQRDEAGEPDQAPEGPRGRRQRAVLALEEIHTAHGMTATEVASGVGVRQPNAYTLLESLVDGGWLERVPESEPAAWRRTGSGR